MLRVMMLSRLGASEYLLCWCYVPWTAAVLFVFSSSSRRLCFLVFGMTHGHLVRITGDASLCAIRFNASSVSRRLWLGRAWARPRYLAFAPGRALFKGSLSGEIAFASASAMLTGSDPVAFFRSNVLAVWSPLPHWATATVPLLVAYAANG